MRATLIAQVLVEADSAVAGDDLWCRSLLDGLTAHGDQAFPQRDHWRAGRTGLHYRRSRAEVGGHGASWHPDGELPCVDRVTFAVCHGHDPGIVIYLANSKYDTVILIVENAEDIAARLSAPSG